MGQVLQALGEELEVIRYKSWMVHLPETGSVLTEVGADQFQGVVQKYIGSEAAQEWADLKDVMRPYASASTALAPIAVRSDAGILVTLARFLPNLFKQPLDILPKLTRPYSEVMAGTIKHPFLQNWMDLLCFLLSGKKADATPTAEIAFMFDDWYKPDAHLEFPVGGSGALVDALVRGLKKFGGELQLGAHVEKILVEDGRAAGVQLRNGKKIHAKKAVVTNATVWDTIPMLPTEAVPEEWRKDWAERPQCESFVHLHLGIDATDLPDDLVIHHTSIEDWSLGVDAPQNLCLVSIPSVLDPGMAPPGKHVIHAYTPGSEPYEVWEGVERGTPEYEALKKERAEVLFRAVEKAIPDVRDRIEVCMIGTPKTQERFLRRSRGTYGGFGWCGEDVEGSSVPTAKTPLPGLYAVGDSNFPGPGVPAVAAGGFSVAHELVPFWKQCELIDEVLP